MMKSFYEMEFLFYKMFKFVVYPVHCYLSERENDARDCVRVKTKDKTSADKRKITKQKLKCVKMRCKYKMLENCIKSVVRI